MKLHFSYLLLLFTFIHSIHCFSQREITLSCKKSDYISGEKIQVNFKTTEPLAQKSWVGMFKASVQHGSTSGYITYHYINEKTSGTYSFEAPSEAGAYEFRVFEEEYGKEVKAIPFNVVSIDPAMVGLIIVSKETKPSQSFSVKVKTTFQMNPKAWVGIFEAGTDKKDNSSYISYQYTGEGKESILQMTAPSKIGDYELRFYTSDPGALVKQVQFRVGALDLKGISFNLNKKEYDPEEDVIIKYTGHKDLTDRAWFGFFKSDATPNDYREYFDFVYLAPKTGGTAIMKAPANKGSYQVRMFYADQGPQLLSPVNFIVTSSLDKQYLKNTIDSEGKITLYGIYFDTNKSIVKQASYPLIEQIAEMLRSDPGLKIRIEGHTDAQGDKAYNQNLSEKRAAAVLSILTKKYQISDSQLESKGYGESKPVGNNSTSLGRSKNRRVELVKI